MNKLFAYDVSVGFDAQRNLNLNPAFRLNILSRMRLILLDIRQVRLNGDRNMTCLITMIAVGTEHAE